MFGMLADSLRIASRTDTAATRHPDASRLPAAAKPALPDHTPKETKK